MERIIGENDLLKVEQESVLISPPSSAESLFLGAALKTSDVTVRKLLGEQKNSLIGRKSGSFHTAQTRGSIRSVDEFMSCAENASDIESIDSIENPLYSHVAVRPSRICLEPTDGTTNNDYSDNMTSKIKEIAMKEGDISVKVSENKPPIADVAPAAPTTTPVDSSSTMNEDKYMQIPVAEAVYGKAKDVLAWGKSVPIVSFFVGTSEAVAGKALGVVGTDLSQLDGKIGSEVTKFDKGILNPAIQAIAKVLIGVAGKSEETIKPIIDAILKPLGMLIKSKTNEQSPEEHNNTPEVTVTK